MQALFKVYRSPLLYFVFLINDLGIFQGTKLEVESVLRETCDRVLDDPTLPPGKAELRAVALQILGEAYGSAKKGENGTEESEYVKVDTKGSRERDKGR